VRIWQGKCALVALGLPRGAPAVLAISAEAGHGDWYPVFLSGVCAVGLSATGLFVMPGMVLATSLAYVLGGGRSLRNRWPSVAAMPST